MFDALFVTPVKNRRLTARDYKTLSLATLGGLLEFYDFIIFVFFANTIGQLFSRPKYRNGCGNFRPSAFSLLVISRGRSAV